MTYYVVERHSRPVRVTINPLSPTIVRTRCLSYQCAVTKQLLRHKLETSISLIQGCSTNSSQNSIRRMIRSYLSRRGCRVVLGINYTIFAIHYQPTTIWSSVCVRSLKKLKRSLDLWYSYHCLYSTCYSNHWSAFVCCRGAGHTHKLGGYVLKEAGLQVQVLLPDVE